jgi:hypothetical protein
MLGDKYLSMAKSLAETNGIFHGKAFAFLSLCGERTYSR